MKHKEDLVKIARENGLQVTRGFAETEETVFPDGPYDVFLSFNFLEHQPEPGVMLRCIRRNLREGGMGLITVPSLEYILQYDGYYELIHDHIAYYNLETLENLLTANGFQVLEREMVNRDTLSVIVRRTEGELAEEKSPAGEVPAGEVPAGGGAAPGSRRPAPVDVSGLAASRRYIDEEVNGLVDRLHSQGKTLAIWGAQPSGIHPGGHHPAGGEGELHHRLRPLQAGAVRPGLPPAHRGPGALLPGAGGRHPHRGSRLHGGDRLHHPGAVWKTGGRFWH